MAADDTFASGQKTKLVMSGFITRAIWHADDGVSEKTFFTGAPASDSRIRWVASGTLNDNVTAGATVEMGMPATSTEGGSTLHGGTDETVGGVDGADDTSWDIRHEYVWASHKKFGKITFGQTAQASSGRGSISANGTDYSRSGRNYGRGLTFLNTTAANPIVSTNTVSSVNSELDVDKASIIRYDTPTFSGVSASVSMSDASSTALGLNYAGKFGGIAVSAGAAYVNHGPSTTSQNFTAYGSISLLHDSGLNLSYHGGKRNFAGDASKTASTGVQAPAALDTNNLGGRDDPYFQGLEVGYRAAKLVGVGGTNFAVTWHSSQNMIENDGDATSWSIRVLQNFDALGANMALSYQKYSYDAEGETTVGTQVNEDYDDIDVIALGTTFNF